MRLKGYAQLAATLMLKSGLHIGTGEKGVERGEAIPIMTSRRTGMPYIPGSSLKGKMRHLLELSQGRQPSPKDPGSPCCCGKCQVCMLFGSGSSQTTFEPSRLIFRDCYPSESSATLLDKIDLEDKPGVRIDRVTGKAASQALFPMKRVPEGCEFVMEVSARIFEDDDPEAVRQWLAMGLYLMEQDALGGGGTRGSGHIEFQNVIFHGTPFDKDWRDQSASQREKLSDVQIKNQQ